MDEKSFPNAKLRAPLLVAYKAFADLAGKGSLFIITIVAARRLTADAFGIFSLGATLGWLLAVGADFGMQLHLAREVARAPHDAHRLLGAWLRVRVRFTAAALGLAAAATLFAGVRAEIAAPLLLLAAVYACSGLVEFLHYFYRGLSRSDIESSLTLWQRGTTLAAGVAALWWRPGVTTLAIAMLIPSAVTLAVSLRIARTLIPDRPAVPPSRDPAVRPLSAFRTDVWPIGAGILLSALYFRIDVFLVEWWSGTAAVALYNAVFRLVEALRLFPAAVLAVLLPLLCRGRDVRRLARVAGGLTIFAVVVAAALWVTAGWTIPLVYGDAYRAAVPAFRILALAFPLLALNNALTLQLVAWDGQRAYAALCGIALAVNVALNAMLIPSQSIDGAAWATLGTEVFLTAGCLAALAARAAADTTAAALDGPALQEAVR